MAGIYSILITGLSPSDENCASAHFSGSGHEVIAAADLNEARERLKFQKIDLVYLRSSANHNTGNVLKEFSRYYPSLPVVLVCDQVAESLILDAWHAGAADILFSPLTPQSLDASLRRGLKKMLARDIEAVRPTDARFFYIDETGKERWADIHSPRFTIGRGSGNNLVLSHMGISRSHAEVLVQDAEFLLRDLGSKLGTCLNGIRVDQAQLANGDRIQLGGVQGISLTFHTGDLLQSLLGSSDPGGEIGLSLRGFRDIGKLFAIFRALSSISVLDDLLALVVDTAVELTGAERGFIMLRENSGELGFRCARSKNKVRLDKSCFQISQRVPHEVLKTGRPVVIKDLDIENGIEGHNVTRQLGLRSISCVPLRYLAVQESDNLSSAGSEIIGVLYVDSANVGAGLSTARMDALESLASEAAMAIYNARLYKDSQDKRRIEEQLGMAHEIQQALLPDPNKDCGYAHVCSQSLPCYEIGGDYFDYFDLADGRLGFALGDVAGKGMSAALLASLVQGIFSVQTYFNEPLPALFSKVNRNLSQRGTGSRFVTFFFGAIGPDGICTYVNAGHNPPFLVKQDGSMQELSVGGTVLGLFAEAQYQTGTLQLQPKDHLVLFTDGVIEALNTKNEEFGIDRLMEVLRTNSRSGAQELLAQLREEVLSFSANMRQQDDITMMVVEFVGPRTPEP